MKKLLSALVLFNILAYGPLSTGIAAAATLAAQPAAKPAAAKPAAAKPAGAKPAAGKPAAGKKASGTQLVTDSKKAIAGILKESKASAGKLDPKNKKQAPFFAGLKELQGALSDVEKKIKAKDKKAFAALSKGSKALAQVKTTWPRVGVKNAKVDGYLSKLDNSYNVLRSHYGSEGLRAKKGGPLSAKEKANFEKIKSTQAEFAKKLGPIQAKAKAKGDKGTEAEVSRLIKQSNGIAAAQLTVDAFLTALLLVDYLDGEWSAYSYYVGPEYRADWAQLDVWVDASFTSCDALYMDTVDSYSVESWDYWETTTEIGADIDFEVTDIQDADITSTDAYLDSSFTYDSLTSESYSEEFATAETETTVYEEEEVNLDVAEETFEDEGLEVESSDAMLDEEDSAELDADTAADDGAAEADEDSDGDGVVDSEDNDDDNDGVVDSQDNDDDGDGVADSDEDSGAAEDDGGAADDDGGAADDDGGAADDSGGDDDSSGVSYIIAA